MSESPCFNSQIEIWNYLLTGGAVAHKHTGFVYAVVDELLLVNENKGWRKCSSQNFHKHRNFTPMETT